VKDFNKKKIGKEKEKNSSLTFTSLCKPPEEGKGCQKNQRP
jgi:hypothetical protein